MGRGVNLESFRAPLDNAHSLPLQHAPVLSLLYSPLFNVPNILNALKVHILRPKYGRMNSRSRQHDAVGHREAEVNRGPCRIESKTRIQIYDLALHHRCSRLECCVLAPLLQHALEYFVNIDEWNNQFVYINSIAGAKKSAFGPSARYSSQPDESTTLLIHGQIPVQLSYQGINSIRPSYGITRTF